MRAAQLLPPVVLYGGLLSVASVALASFLARLLLPRDHVRTQALLGRSDLADFLTYDDCPRHRAYAQHLLRWFDDAAITGVADVEPLRALAEEKAVCPSCGSDSTRCEYVLDRSERIALTLAMPPTGRHGNRPNWHREGPVSRPIDGRPILNLPNGRHILNLPNDRHSDSVIDLATIGSGNHRATQ
jgi:hypothetical protein